MVLDLSIIFNSVFSPLMNFLFSQFPRVLAIPSKEPNYYSQIGGDWHEYHLTNGRKGLVWLCGGKCNLKIEKYHVKGNHELVHPEGESNLDYKIVGEIRNGRLILTENCTKIPTEFFIAIYPNLLSHEKLIGIWAGFDWEQKIISGPMILSRKKIDKSKINEIIKNNKIKNYLVLEEEIAKIEVAPRQPDWINDV